MTSNHQNRSQHGSNTWRRRSISSLLFWRSTLGSSAAWSGSSSRGVHLLDAIEKREEDAVRVDSESVESRDSMIRNITADKRMFHLPYSLRDGVVCNYCNSSGSQRVDRMRLLSHPRIVGAASSRNFSTMGRAVSRTDNGISCMDLDRGGGDNSPSRYLLVGSDCSVSLYDLSYFGSDHYLYQSSSKSKNATSNYLNRYRSKQQLFRSSSIAHVTHRPIARSVRSSTRHNINSQMNDLSSIPSGHRHPVLGALWYPGDVYGSFVSSSISGEILVWDAKNFIPVFSTYTYVYSTSGSTGMFDYFGKEGMNPNKSVAPVQCMDLPKTPEGCPHGRALLALGLGSGSGGRGVIQLCDAFHGGSATHELIGHDSGGSRGGGGINAVMWDPHHPFRLASGGDDGTVRLWDIRKAGAAACLGSLDRELGMCCDDYACDDGDSEGPPRKKQRGRINLARKEEVESHGGPITALTFAPGGDELVSAGLDGRLCHWDLRPDSCYVSTFAFTNSTNLKRKKMRGKDFFRGGMDPSVALGGRLNPFHFTGPKSSSHRRLGKVSLAITQSGSRNSTMLWLAGGVPSCDFSSHGCPPRTQITGYSLFGNNGKESGGPPDVVLSGHLDDVTCLSPVVRLWDNLGVGCERYHSQDMVNLLTGGKDGMVLSWGIPFVSGDNQHIKSEESGNYNEDGPIASCGGSRSSIPEMLQRQWRYRLQQLQQNIEDGNTTGNNFNQQRDDRRRESSWSTHDMDSW